MRSCRVLVLGLLLMVCVLLAACGGSGGSSNNGNTTQPLMLTTTSPLPQATINNPYSFTLQGSGGTGTYTWGISGGSLPPGLSLSSMTAMITGTPTAAGTFTFTAKVTDGAGNVATASLTLNVEGALLITCNSCAPGTTNLPSGSVGVPYPPAGTPPAFSATGGTAPYTWCAVETSGACDNGSGGALPPGLTITTDGNGNGVISGTPTSQPAAPLSVTVQVTDSEMIPAHGTATFTLTIFSITTKTLPNGIVDQPYKAANGQPVEVISAGGMGPYTWCVLNSAGNCDPNQTELPPGLTLGPCVRKTSSACAITGTPTQLGVSSFTLTVTDGETPPATATATLSITISPAVTNGSLNGTYVFSFSGYMGQNSSPVVMAGAVVADGNGDLTSGEFDLNNGSGEPNVSCPNGGSGMGPVPQTLIAGSGYSIQPNGLGTMTLITSSGIFNFNIAIRPDGSGTLIQDNTDPATRGSGVITPQTPGLGIGSYQGPFVVGLIGADPSGNRYAAAGLMMLENTDGDIGTSPLDVDDAGTPSQQSFKGTLSTTVDSLGRGCFGNLNFTQQVLPSCGAGQPNDAFCYAYYLVSVNEVLLISTDPLGGTNNANLALWSVFKQIGGVGFNNSNLNVPSVLELNARDTSGSSDVTAGIFVGQGSSSDTCPTMDAATFTFDENQNGSGPGQQVQTATGTYCIDSHTGRVTLSGFSGWGTSPPVMYYAAPLDPGAVVGTDTAVTAGIFELQGAGPFSDANVSGAYWGATFMPAASIITDSVTELFADGVGDITATQYTSGPNGPGGPNQLTLTYSVDTTGRAVVMQNGNEFGVLYVVGPNKFVLVPTGSNPALSIFISGQAD